MSRQRLLQFLLVQIAIRSGIDAVFTSSLLSVSFTVFWIDDEGYDELYQLCCL